MDRQPRQLPVLEALAGGACLTTRELTEAIGIDRRATADACSKLVSRGFICRRERGCFEISPSGRTALADGIEITSGPNGPLTQRTPRDRKTKRLAMWNAIRIARKFSLADLEMTAGVGRDNARKYVRALERAGYLIKLRREPGHAPTSNGFCRWMLIQDPGPQAPVYRSRTGEVFDPNSGTAIGVRP